MYVHAYSTHKLRLSTYVTSITAACTKCMRVTQKQNHGMYVHILELSDKSTQIHSTHEPHAVSEMVQVVIIPHANLNMSLLENGLISIWIWIR